jgi:hypothetical protein
MKIIVRYPVMETSGDPAIINNAVSMYCYACRGLAHFE